MTDSPLFPLLVSALAFSAVFAPVLGWAVYRHYRPRPRHRYPAPPVGLRHTIWFNWAVFVEAVRQGRRLR